MPIKTQSFFSLKAGTKVRESRVRFKLFLILKKAGQHYQGELCPDDPRSIVTKAHDILRNVNLWNQRLQDQAVGLGHADSYDHELSVYDEVVEKLEKVIPELQRPGAGEYSRSHCRSLMNFLMSAVLVLEENAMSIDPEKCYEFDKK